MATTLGAYGEDVTSATAFKNVTASNFQNKVAIDIMNLGLLPISCGSAENLGYVHKFGRNPDIDSAAAEDVWDAGGIYVFPTAGSTLAVVSSNAADTSGAGVGAHVIAISGLDANYAPYNETIALSGTTAVPTSGAFLRVNRMVVLTGGASGANIGSLVVTHGSNTISQITVGYNQTLQAVYTVASGVDAYIMQLFSTINKNATAGEKEADIQLRVRPSGGVPQLKDVFSINNRGNGGFFYNYPVPVRIPQKSDVFVRSEVAANNTDVSAGFDLVEINVP